MIIDFHTHVFPDELAPRALAQLRADAPDMVNQTDGTLLGLLDSMRKSGISKSVVLPVSAKAEQVRPINLNAVRIGSESVVAFGSLFPRDVLQEEEIEFLRMAGIKGVKLHPEYQNFHVDDPAVFPLYEALNAAQMIVVFHAGWDPGPFTCNHALPHAIAKVAREFPDLRIVAAHMGGFQVWDDVMRELVGSRAYFDTSAVIDTMPPGQFMRIARRHGTRHILFGTDSPWFDQARYVKWIDALPLKAVEKERIFAGNARQLLGMA